MIDNSESSVRLQSAEATGERAPSRPPRVEWRRSPVSADFLGALGKSDAHGWVQSGGHLAIFVITGALTVAAARASEWALFIPLLVAHGVVASFLTNGIHELSHGTVFATGALNRAFLNLFCFIRWINPHAFWASHSRHHRFTLYPPHDLEVILPMRFTLPDFLRRAVLDPMTMFERFRLHGEYSARKFRADWDRQILSDEPTAKRVARWSRAAFAAHLFLMIGAVAAGEWALVLVISLTPAYGGGLFFLCNNTQHAGMESQTPDFRKSCRTMRLNPVLEFFYWRMNFHAEHHMYPNVPCYRLASLHERVAEDLPKTKCGLVPVWKEILTSQHK